MQTATQSHPARRLLCAVEGAGQVHCEDALPVGLVDLEERLADRDARVRDEHVEAAEQLVALRERIGDLLRVRDVTAQGSVETADPFVSGRDLFLADRERDDARALIEEAAARRLADPARAAGDDDALAREPFHCRRSARYRSASG